MSHCKVRITILQYDNVLVESYHKSIALYERKIIF